MINVLFHLVFGIIVFFFLHILGEYVSINRFCFQISGGVLNESPKSGFVKMLSFTGARVGRKCFQRSEGEANHPEAFAAGHQRR